MPPPANLPLQSYELAQRSAPLACVVCGQENCASAERCRGCGAPISLSRNAGGDRRAPALLAVVGAAGVGKTVYLGMMMEMLTRGVGGLRATVRGPNSIALQQQASTALAACCYPDPTPEDVRSWSWVHCLVTDGRRRPVELILVDAAGAAWTQEADRPGTHPALAAVLEKASGVIVLEDTHRLHGGDHDDDFTVMKLLAQLHESREPKGGAVGGRSPAAARTPLALVLAKADACPSCLERPSDFAEAHATTLLRDCEARFRSTRVFAATVAGCSTERDAGGRRRHVPLRIEPRGVVEPLAWLLSQLP